MRNFFRFVLILICWAIWAQECYALDDREVKHHPAPEEYQKDRQDTHPSRPILPSAIPSGPTGVSPAPTPTPHISAPPVSATITVPSTPAAGYSARHHIPATPSIPTPVMAPNVPVPSTAPKIPTIGNTIGIVLNKGEEKDTLWIDVKDQLFNETIKVKIKNLKNTPIVKQASIMKFGDIKIGDTVNAIFRTEGDENIATFISIMTEEELEMMKAASHAQVETEEKKSEEIGLQE